MRLFCAIDTDPALHPALAQVVEKLRLCGADARWTTPSQWHVTLKFLGEVGAMAIPEIIEILARVAGPCPPEPLRLNGIGVFGGLVPRVAFAKVEDPAGSLEKLACALDRGLSPLGFHTNNQIFNPHITLARVRSRRNAPALLEAVRREPADLRGTWTAREIVLYQSILSPTGAEYSAIFRAPLSGKRESNPVAGVASAR